MRWRPIALHLGGALLAVLCTGADCFPSNSSGDGGGGGYVGLGAPAVELTVDGTHVGPYAASPDARADLVTSRNPLGQVLSSELIIHASAGPAACDMHLSRFGTGVLPFGAGAYRVMAAVGSSTPDGTASPLGGMSATAGQLKLACNGSDCDTAVLANTIVDAAHLEGYLTATMYDYTDGQASSIVCSYYLPWGTYQP